MMSDNIISDFNVIIEKIRVHKIIPLIIRNLEKYPMKKGELERYNLPKFKYNIVNKCVAEECPICLENKTSFNQTNCKHLFCTDCFGGIQNHRCPLCRANLLA